MTEKRVAPYPAGTLSKGWRFELNMEQVKKSETWLRARNGYVRAHLLLLWSEAWEQTPCGSLPNDDELLALLLDMDQTEFAKLRGVLLRGWWEADDGRLYHDTIAERVLDMLSRKAGERNRKAAWRARQSSVVPRDTTETGQGLTQESHWIDDTGTGTGTGTRHPTGVAPAAPASAPKPRRTRSVKTPIPEGFGISERVRAWASEKGFEKLDEHLEAFVRKANAKGYTYADWDLAFMEAVREDWAKLRSNGRGGAAAPAGERATVPSTAFEQTQEYLRRRELTPAERDAAEKARLMVMSSIKVISGGNR